MTIETAKRWMISAKPWTASMMGMFFTVSQLPQYGNRYPLVMTNTSLIIEAMAIESSWMNPH